MPVLVLVVFWKALEPLTRDVFGTFRRRAGTGCAGFGVSNMGREKINGSLTHLLYS